MESKRIGVKIMKYPKINTIWKRDEKTGKIIEGDFSKPEFANIVQWLITEKIDGTNIRVIYESGDNQNGSVTFGGRTDEAQIPAHLIKELETMFTPLLFESNLERNPEKMILFGEGYGPKIQKGGGLYRDDAGFILFDVWVETEGNGWWLTHESVEEIATSLNIPVVPVISICQFQDAINYVRRNPLSAVAKQEKVIEGVVARSHPLVLFRDGTPVMWKIKVRDFQ